MAHMKIHQIIEMADGSVDFHANLSTNQVHLLLEMAMDILINNGVQLVDTRSVVVVEEPEGMQ